MPRARDRDSGLGVPDQPIGENLDIIDEENEDIMAQAGANVHITPRPLFSGEGTTEQVAVDAQAFILRFDSWTRSRNIANDDKAAALIECFPEKSKATLWWLPLYAKPSTLLKTWDEILQLFRARFIGVASPAELLRAQATLQMKKEESVLDFFDRVEGVQNRFDTHLSAALTASTVPAAHVDTAVEIAHGLYGMVTFVAGLRSDLKQIVTAQGPNSLTQAQQQAVLAESSLKDGGTKPSAFGVASLDRQQLLDQRAEINALLNSSGTNRGGFSSRGRGGFSGRGSFSGRGRGGFSSRGGYSGRGGFRDPAQQARPLWLRLNTLPDDVCYTCGKQRANHLSRDCKVAPHNYEWPQLIERLKLKPPSQVNQADEASGERGGAAANNVDVHTLFQPDF